MPIQKGEHLSHITEFKKGQKFRLDGKPMGREKGCVPWNKDIHQWEGRQHPTKGKKMPKISKMKKEWWAKQYFVYNKKAKCKCCEKIFEYKRFKKRLFCSYHCSNSSRKHPKEMYEKIAKLNRERGNFEKVRQRMLNGGAIKARWAARLARPSKGQLKLYERVKEYFPTAELEYPLKTSKTMRFLDIAIPDKRFCIEYDGIYWHKNTQEYDAERQKEIEEIGWKVIRVKEGDKDAV